MSFPFVFEEDFEAGTIGNFDVETDVDGKAAVTHWVNLVQAPPYEPPWRGAYAFKVDLAGGSTADGFVQENGSFDHVADAIRYLRFYFYAANLTMAASDRFAIFAIQATATDHVIVELFNNAGTIQLRAGQNGTGGTLRATPLAQNQWNAIELALAYDGAGDGSGTIDFYVNGGQVGAQITGLTQAASTHARFGANCGATVVNTGTTAGQLLFDQIVYDDTNRVYPMRRRWDRSVFLTKSGHASIGPGRLSAVRLISGGASDNSVILYDTDEGNTFDSYSVVGPRLQDIAGENAIWEASMKEAEEYFTRGLYVSMSGTSPRAQLVFDDRILSEGGLKNYGKRRTPHGTV